MASSQDDLGDLPEFVRDSRLEVIFQSNGNKFYTIHPRAASRRGVHAQDKWLHTRTLGAGGQGTVDLQTNESRHARLPQVRAVKKIYIAVEKEEPSKLIRRELEAIFKFSQARYSELFVHSYGWFMSDRWVYIAMEYYELGDLQSYLQNKSPDKRLSESDILPIASQVLDALYMMHREGFSHRDLKPANILIKDQPPLPWWVKLGDFGISKRGSEISQTTAIRGTPSFMPPELHGFFKNSHRHSDGYEIDIWCLGGTIYRALTGHHVFEDLSDLALYCTGIGQFPDLALKQVNASDNLIQFLSSIVVADPSKRPTAEDASAHPWIESQWATAEPDTEENDPQSQQSSADQVKETGYSETQQHAEDADTDVEDSEQEQPLVDVTEATSVEPLGDGMHSGPSSEPIDVSDETEIVLQLSPVTAFKPEPSSIDEPSASWTANLDDGVRKPFDVLKGHEAEIPQLPKKSERRQISALSIRTDSPQTAQNGTVPTETIPKSVEHELQQVDEPSASWTAILHGDASTVLSPARNEQTLGPEVKKTSQVAAETPSEPAIPQITIATLRRKWGSVGQPSASTIGQGFRYSPPPPKQANEKPSVSSSAPLKAAKDDLNTVKSTNATTNESHTVGSATTASVVIRTDTPPIPVSSLKSLESYYSPSPRVNKQPKEEPQPIRKRSDSWIHGGFGNAPDLPLSRPRDEGPKLPPLSGLKDKDGASFKITSWGKVGKEALGYKSYSEQDLPLTSKTKDSSTGSSPQVNYSYPRKVDNVTQTDEAKVLCQAASIFEFHTETVRYTDGYPFLVYDAGDVFDIVAVKGELWLGRNQDDSKETLGWIWEKHLVKLGEVINGQN